MYASEFSTAVMLLKARKREIFGWMWCVVVTCLIATKGFPPLVPTIMSLAAVFFITASVYVYNDVIDIDADKINKFKSYRPLPSGKVQVKDALKFVYICGFVGLAISFFLGLYAFVFTLLYFFLFFFYSYPKIHFKRRFLFKEIIITSGTLLMTLIGSYAVSGTLSFTAFFASLITMIFLFTGQPALNDTLDIEADVYQGVKSLASILSWKRKIQLFITGVLIIMTLTPLTYVQFGFNMLLPIYTVAGGLVFLRFLFPITESFELVYYTKIKKGVYVFAILLQLFSIFGSLNFNII